MAKKRTSGGFKLSKLKQPKALLKSRSRAPARKVLRPTLAAQDPEKSLPPVFMGREREVLGDPWALLGLGPDDPRDAAAIEAAFRKALTVTTPERDPEGARALMEARQFLLSRENALLRKVGDLRVPNPEKFFDGYVLSDTVRELLAAEAAPIELMEEAAATSAEAPSPAPVKWSSHSRIMTLMTLLALVEAEIEGDIQPDRCQQEKLF